MRVLHSFPDTLGKPGIGTIALEQLRGATGSGADVVPVCTSVHPRAAMEAETTLTVFGRRIPHRALLGAGQRAYRVHDRRTARLLQSRTGQIDVVHVWPAAVSMTAAVAREAGIPVVREAPNAHTAYMFDAVARETARLGIPPVPGHSHSPSAARLAQEQREYEQVDALLVPSEFVRRTFLDRGVPEDKLILHQYGYHPGRFHAPAERDTSRPLTMAFVARLEPIKGLHFALDAWFRAGLHERAKLLVCGRMTAGYDAVISCWLPHPSVEMLGFVPDPGELMRRCDAFVLPSLVEGSALVTYEAQASGCALVVSDATGARCEEGRQGLVHRAGDVDQLAEHLRMLADDDDLVARLRAGALENARRLTWADAGRRLVEIYEGIARR